MGEFLGEISEKILFEMEEKSMIIGYEEPILITGASGFIGSRVVETLLRRGFRSLRCFVRPSSKAEALLKLMVLFKDANIEIFEGNLLREADCKKATSGVSIIYHLAAGRGEKSYPNAFLNSVVTTRNLLEASLSNRTLKRVVNVGSFAVYSNHRIRRNGLLDETCPLENNPAKRGEAYCYAKVRQEEIVLDYGRRFNIPYVLVRPGVVYGPGNKGLTGRVGIGTFGIFLHLGGSNIIPLSYVDNCAEAIVLAGLIKGIDGEIFNIVDDDLITSRHLLRLYKKNVGDFPSIYLAKSISFLLSYFWERYSNWSKGQLPPSFNRNKWESYWKGNRYNNKKLHELLGWHPVVGLHDALKKYFEYQKTMKVKL